VHAKARQIGARAQRAAQHIRLRAFPSRQLTARVHIQRRLAVSHTAGAGGGGRQIRRVAGGIFAPGARNQPVVEKDALMAAERGRGGLVRGRAVVRIADDLSRQAVVIPPQQLEHGAQEDPLELLPEDAVDDEVHRAVGRHQEVGGLGERQEDFPGMLKSQGKEVILHFTSVCLSFWAFYFYSHSFLSTRVNFGCLVPMKSISCFYISKFSKLQPFLIMFSSYFSCLGSMPGVNNIL
jgi:hypothetical protein